MHHRWYVWGPKTGASLCRPQTLAVVVGPKQQCWYVGSQNLLLVLVCEFPKLLKSGFQLLFSEFGPEHQC